MSPTRKEQDEIRRRRRMIEEGVRDAEEQNNWSITGIFFSLTGIAAILFGISQIVFGVPAGVPMINTVSAALIPVALGGLCLAAPHYPMLLAIVSVVGGIILFPRHALLSGDLDWSSTPFWRWALIGLCLYFLIKALRERER